MNHFLINQSINQSLASLSLHSPPYIPSIPLPLQRLLYTMADDSVPLPYPNLKVPQWSYQIQQIPRLAEEASSSLWKAIEADGELSD